MDRFLKRSLENEVDESVDQTIKKRKEKDTLTICSHNCNSLYNRITRDNKNSSYNSLIEEHDIDLLFLQEVRAPANKDNRSMILYDNKKKDEKQLLESFLKVDFDKYYSLADTRYSGTLLAIRKGIEYKWIAYNFQAAYTLEKNSDVKFNEDFINKNHYIEGRVIIIHFEKFTILGTYSPNNGSNEKGYLKREKYDNEVKLFCENWKHPLIWIGDLNIAPERNDTTHPDIFENENPNKNNQNPDYRGMPGVTKIERKRFQEILNSSELVDAWKLINGHQNRNANELYPAEESNFTWYYHHYYYSLLLLLFIIITVIHYHRRGGEGTYHKKAMRLDHVFVSRKLIDEQNIIDCRILGHGYDKAGFLGSDHCPIKVVVSIK